MCSCCSYIFWLLLLVIFCVDFSGMDESTALYNLHCMIEDFIGIMTEQAEALSGTDGKRFVFTVCSDLPRNPAANMCITLVKTGAIWYVSLS